MSIVENYHQDALQAFRNYKKLAERAMGQVSDEEFFARIDAESNAIAMIVKHIAGNQHSRWRDFLTTDGEKEDRHRDREFELTSETRESLMEFWETGWQTLFDNIGPLTPEDFEKTVTIRGEPHTIVEAMNRQLAHYPTHIGHLGSTDWKTLSVPRNRSAEFNQYLSQKQAAGEIKINPLDAVADFAQDEKGGS